jgi:hypothetical protein
MASLPNGLAGGLPQARHQELHLIYLAIQGLFMAFFQWIGLRKNLQETMVFTI